MSERIAAEIRIGGPVPSGLVPALIEAIHQEGVHVSWEEVTFDAKTAEDLLELALDDEGQLSCLSLVDVQARWGQFDDLEAFLVKHGIAFDRFSEAQCDYPAEHAWFRPGMKETQCTLTEKSAGRPVVCYAVLEDIANALEQNGVAEARRVLTAVRASCCPPKLGPLAIVDKELM